MEGIFSRFMNSEKDCFRGTRPGGGEEIEEDERSEKKMCFSETESFHWKLTFKKNIPMRFRRWMIR